MGARKKIGLLAIVLTGCASPGFDYEMRVAPTANVTVAQQAAWGWEEGTRRDGQPRLEIHIVSSPYGCSGHYCIFVEEVAHDDVGFPNDPLTSCPHPSLGCTLTMPDSQSSHVKVSNSLDGRPELQLAAYAHELGHALGLVYEGGPVLMDCTGLGQGIEGPTPDDVTQFYDVRGIGRPGFARSGM